MPRYSAAALREALDSFSFSVDAFMGEKAIEMLIRWAMRARQRLQVAAYHWANPRQAHIRWLISLRSSVINWTMTQNYQEHQVNHHGIPVIEGEVESVFVDNWAYRPGYLTSVGGQTHTHWMGRQTGGGSVDSWMEIE